MQTQTSRRRASALALVGLLLAGSLAGCLDRSAGDGYVAEAPEVAAEKGGHVEGWQLGNWWAYRATFEGNVTVDVALVVYEDAPTHLVLGSNLSAGFFGLPFNGNVTRPHLNPVIGREEWRLFDFPLSDGKAWEYPLFGYTLRATASRATLTAPGVGEHPGFDLTASSFGRTVAHYTYSPEVEWFTRLVIYEPTDGRELVRVELTDFGESYHDDYFVNVPVDAFEADYPGAVERGRFVVEGSFIKLFATVVLKGELGDFRFDLRTPEGRSAMRGELRPQGVLLDRRTLEAAPGAWTLDHLGVGKGRLLVELHGMQAARQGQLLAPDEASSALLANAGVSVPSILLDLAPAAEPDAPLTSASALLPSAHDARLAAAWT